MFRQPAYVAWLPLALAAAAIFLWRAAARRQQVTKIIGDAATIDRLLPAEAAARRRVQSGLRLAAVALLFLALAGPQWGIELTPMQTLAQDVVIAVDVSTSMMAEDLKPNRLARAKEELSLLIDELKGCRIAVIAFAGEPALVCPLTTDLAAAKQLLRSLEPGFVPVPGTAIGKAIRRAVGVLARDSGSRTIVLLSDGEDHETDPLGAADAAASEGIQIFTIGIGTPGGEPIPVRDQAGTVTGYKKDKKGATVVSRLGEGDLGEIAKRTRGQYHRSSPGANEATEIARQIRGGGQGGLAAATTRRYKNHFLIPLVLAFILLLIETALPERRVALLLIALFAGVPAKAAGSEESLRRGNKLYYRDEFLPALEHYGRAAAAKPDDRRPVFNAGDALYKLEQYDKAAEAFSAAAQPGAPAQTRSAAYYNLGNAYYQKNQYKEAVDAFRKAVTLNPADEQARHNLAVALRRLKNPPPQSPKNNKSDPNKPPEKDKPQDQKGGGQPPEPKTKPKDQISKEDAERILRAIADKERAPQKKEEKAPGKRPDPEKDW